MRVSIRRIALTLSLPVAAGLSAVAQEGYYDDGQPPAAIALFTSENFYGDVREAFDPFASMHDLAFNDRARSAAVLAGQWELCEHANFTGRCVFIREDVADLSWFGLQGRVSSIRPVFEYTEAQHGLMFTRDDHGYIRYAHNEAYGYDTWNYGYSSSVRLSTQHYGYSPDYWRFGYYDPRWGYDPYGFAWRPYGGPRYVSYTYRVHPRPVVINTYWKKHWGKSHKHWDRRGHRDDWRQKPGWRGRNDDRGPGRGNGGWDRDQDHDHDRDRDRDRDRARPDGRPGWNGDRPGRPPRTDDRDRGWGAGDRARRGGDGPRTDRAIPVDPRRGAGRGDGRWTGGGREGARDDRGSAGRDRGDRGGRGPGAGSAPPPVTTPVVTPTPPRGRPSTDRPNREGGRGDRGRDRGRGGEGGLLGAPSGPRPIADVPRAGGIDRGGDRGGDRWRGGEGGGRVSAPAPSYTPPPPAPQTAVSRPAPPPRVERGRGGDGGSDRGRRRPGSAQD